MLDLNIQNRAILPCDFNTKQGNKEGKKIYQVKTEVLE